MFTTRLPTELDEQLEYHSNASGRPKNAIVTDAIALYLKTVNMSQMPTQKLIQETDYDRYVRQSAAKKELYRHAHEIADWIRRNLIWTKKPGKAEGGHITPGFHGRNVVVGFTDSFRPIDNGTTSDDKLYVISRNLFTVGRGTDSFHLDMTEWDHWNEYMHIVHEPH